LAYASGSLSLVGALTFGGIKWVVPELQGLFKHLFTQERPTTMMPSCFATAKPEIQKLLQRMTIQLREALPAGSFGDREQAALAFTNEVVRRTLEQELQDIADSFEDLVEYQGALYRRHELGGGKYPSLCGSLELSRHTYRLVGVHNGPTIVPMELEAGLIGGATPELARNVAHGYGENHMRAHFKSLEKAHRIPPPRATMERLAKRLAAKVSAETPRIEPKIRRLERVPKEAYAIVVGVDRTSAPMEEPSDKPTKRRKKPYVRTKPAPVEVNYRMAYTATVTLVDKYGEALVIRRYAIEASDAEHILIARAMADARHYLAQRPDLLVGVVQDGAPEMWNLVRPELEKLRLQGVISKWSEAIDFCHLLERLGEALELIGEKNPKGRLQGWRNDLEVNDGTIDSIASFLRFHRRDVKNSEKLEKLNSHITYIENNNDRMRYRTMRKQGLPIGSGITESSCKTVVNMRANGAGQRWHCPGLRGALHLRALNASDRFDAFWVVLARMHVANINNYVDAA
jgi:hypothetical protein